MLILVGEGNMPKRCEMMREEELPNGWQISAADHDSVTFYYDIDTKVEIRKNGCIVLRNDSTEIHFCEIEGFAKDVATIRKLYFTE